MLYTKPRTRLRRAETIHMLNGFVSPLRPAGYPMYEGATTIPENVARRLVALGPALGMNYRLITVGHRPMLFGRPVSTPEHPRPSAA
jgi:hypothetical protein